MKLPKITEPRREAPALLPVFATESLVQLETGEIVRAIKGLDCNGVDYYTVIYPNGSYGIISEHRIKTIL